MFTKTVKMISVGSLFLIPFFPLIVTNGLFSPFIVGKVLCFYILVEVAFVCSVLLAVIEPKYRPKLTPLTLTVTLFLAISLVADLLGVNPLHSLWSNFERMSGWITLFHLWAFYIAIIILFKRGIEGKALWFQWMNLSVLAAALSAVYGLFQVFGWSYTHGSGARIDSFFGNPSYFAIYLLVHIFICFYLYSTSSVSTKKSYRYKWVYIFLSVIFIIEILETQTRGGAIALVVGVVTFLVVYAIFGKTQSRRMRFTFGLAAFLICILVITYLGFRNTSFVKGNAFLARFSAVSWQESAGRQYLWPMAVKGIKKRSILGWGEENFPAVFEKYYNPHMNGQEPWVDQVHNIFLDEGISGGILGLLAYLSLYILGIMYIWKSGLPFVQKCIVTAFIASYFVHHLFIFETLSGSLLFWFILAYTDSLFVTPGDASKSLNLPRNKIFVLGAVGLIFLAFLVYFLSLRPLSANVYLSKGMRLCATPLPSIEAFEAALKLAHPMATEDIREQLIYCAENIIMNPLVSNPSRNSMINLSLREISHKESGTSSVKFDMLASSFFESIGKFSEAETVLLKAYARMPTKDIVGYRLSSLYLHEGKVDAALTVLATAKTTNPESTKAEALYAIALAMGPLVNTKEYEKMRIEFENLISPPDPTDLMLRQAQTLYAQGNTTQAFDILRKVEQDHPEYRDQIEEAMKEAK